MRKLLAAMFAALLMVGCGEDSRKPAEDSSESNQSSAETPPAQTAEVGGINLDDNETRNRIIAEATDADKLQLQGKEGDKLSYAPNEETPYKGWSREMWDNGQIYALIQYKDGKKDGLETHWHRNGQKEWEENYKDGKLDGPSTEWHKNGTEIFRAIYKDGEQAGPIANPSDIPKITYSFTSEESKQWAKWEANPKPYGGLEALAKIREAKESGVAELLYESASRYAPLQYKKITDLTPLGELTNLKKLDLQMNRITDLRPLAELTKLEALDLSNNRITDLRPLAALTNLTDLTLSYNHITDLTPLAALTNLTDLTLNGNEITDVTPLAGLKNLSGLGLGRNEITDIGPLSELKNLTGLELHHNYTRRGNYDLTPLAGLTKLEWLNLEFNFITEDQKAMLRKTLPNCNMIF